jgi:hypothetical protein
MGQNFLKVEKRFLCSLAMKEQLVTAYWVPNRQAGEAWAPGIIPKKQGLSTQKMRKRFFFKLGISKNKH